MRKHTHARRSTSTEPARIAPDYSAMLREAVTNPGTVAAAYRMFHNYSTGNQIWAALQLAMRGMPLSPIASYRRWQELGRQVRKGETALSLYMPVTCKSRRRDEDATERGDAEARDTDAGATYTKFICRPHWFALCQTDGPDAPPEVSVPEWDTTRALAALDVQEVAFEDLRGNVGGYAEGRTIAISPLSPTPHRTRLHELAHVVLGHTAGGVTMTDEAAPSRAVGEVEAEAVAYLCLASLGLPGLDDSRGYLQGWLAAADRANDGETLDDRRTARIFRAADQILRAGRPAAEAPADATNDNASDDLQRAAA